MINIKQLAENPEHYFRLFIKKKFKTYFMKLRIIYLGLLSGLDDELKDYLTQEPDINLSQIEGLSSKQWAVYFDALKNTILGNKNKATKLIKDLEEEIYFIEDQYILMAGVEEIMELIFFKHIFRALTDSSFKDVFKHLDRIADSTWISEIIETRDFLKHLIKQ